MSLREVRSVSLFAQVSHGRLAVRGGASLVHQAGSNSMIMAGSAQLGCDVGADVTTMVGSGLHSDQADVQIVITNGLPAPSWKFCGLWQVRQRISASSHACLGPVSSQPGPRLEAPLWRGARSCGLRRSDP